MSVEQIKAAVSQIVSEKADASQVADLEAKNAEQAQTIESLQAQIKEAAAAGEEVKQLVADLEAKQADAQVATKATELTFDMKALNAKLKEVMSGDRKADLGKMDTKALTIGGSGGEALAIDDVLGTKIIERARENVVILGLIANKNVGSVNYREMVLRAYPTTGKVGEQTGASGNGTVWAQTGTQTYVEVKMNVAKQYAKPLISNEAIADPHIDIFAHLETLLAEETSRYWAKQVLFGTGTGNDLRGILHDDATNGRLDPTKSAVADAGTRDVDFYHAITSGVADSIGAADPTAANSAIDTAIDLTIAVPSKYLAGSKFIMNRRTLGQYRKLKDLEGRPLIKFEAGSFDLVGYPVVIEDYMPDTNGTNAGPNTAKFPVIFGDLSKAYALCHIDNNFLVDPYSADGAVMIKMESRKGDLVQNNDAIVVLVSNDTWA